MSATGDGPFLRDLELNVQAELAEAQASQAVDAPVEEWLFDPAYAQREEVGLRSLLGAVESLEEGSGPA